MIHDCNFSSKQSQICSSVAVFIIYFFAVFSDFCFLLIFSACMKSVRFLQSQTKLKKKCNTANQSWFSHSLLYLTLKLISLYLSFVRASIYQQWLKLCGRLDVFQMTAKSVKSCKNFYILNQIMKNLTHLNGWLKLLRFDWN